MRIDLHVNQSLASPHALLDLASRAERGPYECLWVLDHLATMRPNEVPGEMLDPHVLLGAIAARTSRLGLGVLVNNAALRPAEVIAGATASLDLLSEGRAVLGIGAGTAPGTWFAAEHEALNRRLEASLNLRHDRLFDALSTIERIWSGEVDSSVRFPKPTRKVPVVVGVNSVTLARRVVAAGHGINVRFDHPRIDDILALSSELVGDYASTVWLPFDQTLCDPGHPTLRSLAAKGVKRVMLLIMKTTDLLNV